MYRRKPGGNWYISIGGRRVSSKTKNRELARIKEGKDNAEIWKRDNGLVVLTWDQACLSWQDDNPGPSKLPHNENYVAWWTDRLKGKRLPDITRALIHGIIVKNFDVELESRVPANATANGYVSFAGRIIEHGLKYRPKFIHYPKIKFRTRLLKPEEWAKLTPHLAQDELDIFTYLLATGVREANAMHMEWPWVDGLAVTIPPERFKTRVPHAYPLNRTAQAVLERRRASSVKHLKFVFTRNGKPWYRKILVERLHDACALAGIEDMVVHGLKHAFNSWLAKARVPKEIRMRLLGHATKDVHDGYTHLDIEDLRPYSEVFDRVMDSTNRSQAEEGLNKTAS